MFYQLKKDHLGREKYVSIRYFKGGKVVVIPREETKHLDGQSDFNIKAWMSWYANKMGHAHKDPTNIEYHPRLMRLVDRYLEFLTSREADFGTVKSHRTHLVKYVIPFFLDAGSECIDPNKWPRHSVKMLDWLTSQNISKNSIRICNVALRKMWKWMSDHQEVLLGSLLPVLNPVNTKRETPLEFSLKPDEVLAFAKDPTRDRLVRLMALTGYFFSLRTQEIFGIQRQYFQAGSKASGLECIKTMLKAGLDGKLAFNVQRQVDDKKTAKQPKVGSRGWVCCFNNEAARLIVDILKESNDIGDIFEDNPHVLYTRWRTKGIQNITLKDLRRASIYWLGHYTDIPIVALQSHARHADLRSTQKYLRRPQEELPMDSDPLDLDA